MRRVRTSRSHRPGARPRASFPAAAAALLALALPALAGPPPGTPIDNVATGAAVDSASGGSIVETSNTVRVVVEAAAAVPPELAFHTDATFTVRTTVGAVGGPLHLEAVAPACDLDPLARDTVSLALAVDRTGDGERFTAIETGVATGRFRIAPPVSTADGAAGATSGNGVIEALRNDHVVATLAGCGAAYTQAHLWFDPAGVVFDARTNAPLRGASVTLIDVLGAGNGGIAGGPARVWQSDGATLAPSTVLTDAAGRYVFPAVAPGVYRLDVAPPAPWTFPSASAPGALPAGRHVDAAGSYGRDFAVAVAGSPVRWDVPADAAALSPLVLEMSAARPYVEPGDDLDWTLRVENRADSALALATLNVELPHGFAYLPRTARRDGAAAADPAGGRGPALAFALGSLAPRSAATVVLRTRIGPDAPLGDAIARGRAAGAGATSNPASARVTVAGGAFAEEAMLSGAVFVDRDGDGRRGADDPGMPGVRLWLDDGTYAITDPDGRYSFYGLAPRTHALKVDATSLPDLARLVAADHRDGSRGGLRFVDLQRGDFQRADVAIAADTASLIAATERRAAHTRFTSEITRSLREGVSLEAPPTPAGDPRSRPVAGIAGGESGLPLFERGPGLAVATEATLASADPRGVAAAPLRSARIPLETLLPTFVPIAAFVDLADRDTLPASTIAVRVQGPFGVPLELRVNGAVVPESRVGLRVASEELGVQAWEFVGVRLEPGINLLEVSTTGALARAAVRVVAPDVLGRLVVTTGGHVPADGHSVAHVRVRALDPRGVTVRTRTFVTLAADLGRWLADDLDPAEPGLQTVIEGGVATFGLIAPTTPGTVVVRARAGDTRAEGAVEFLPELRPLVAVGALEGVVSLADLSRGPRAPRRIAHGFEAPIGFFADERRDGRAGAAARGSVFLKGRVRDDVLLTLGFDSDRPDGLRRFRDIQPHDFYPVYGDASVRGYEAQSTGRLFMKLERRGSSLLYGDFVTLGTGGSRSLASYSRSLTGVQHHFESPRVRVDAFSSRERTRRRVDELPGLGLSGPYALASAPIVENSERVEIVTRDRDQPAVVLEARPQARFTDYELDPLTGRLLFKSPVPSVDAALNPVSIRIAYEIEGEGRAFWASGAEARVRLTDRLEVGGSYVDDLEPGAARELRGAFVGARLSDLTRAELEYAATHANGGGRGHGARIELVHEAPRAEARLHGAFTDARFDNPTAGYAGGRSEAGARWLARLDERSQLRGEALYTADAGGASRRGGALVGLDRTVSRTLRGEVGLRLAAEHRRDGGAADPLWAVRGKLSSQWPRHPGVSGYAEAEHDVRSARRLLALGGEVRLRQRGRLYTRHELVSSLAGPFALHPGARRLANVLGLDAGLGRDAQVFSEYRMGEALSGREAEAAVGLRNTWRLPDGLRLGGSLERVSTLAGPDRGPITAIATSLDYREHPDWKGSARYELRSSRAGESFLSTMALAGRLDSAWTAMCRNVLAFADERSGGHARERFLIGLAHRPAGARAWETLGRYELRFDRDQAPGESSRRRVAHVLSAHAAGRVRERWTPSVAAAAKTVSERAAGVTTHGRAVWLHGRLAWDFARVWDAGVSASTRFGGSIATRRDGAGIEVGRMMRDGVWLSAGWNYFGYEDPDLPDEAWTRRGLYVRLRARFDETLLQRATRSLP